MHHLFKTRRGNILLVLFAALLANGAMCGGGMGGLGNPFKKHKSKTRLNNNGKGGVQGNFDLGKAAYEILLRDLQNSTGPCKAQRVAAFQARRDSFIYAVNTIFSPNVRKGLVPTLNDLLVLVDTGIVPRMTDDVAKVLTMLRADNETLDALVALAGSKTGFAALDKRDMLKLVSRFINFPEFEELVYALARLVQNDNRGLVNSGLEFVSGLLKDMKTQPAASGSPGDSLASQRVDLVAELLKKVEIVGEDQLGQPVMIPILDKDGNPTGTEVDAKRTVLSLILQMGATGVEKGLHRDLATLFQYAAGSRVSYDNGTGDPSDDYLGYSKTSALAEMNHGTLELLKYEHAPKLLETLSVLFEQKADLAEDLLVKIGKVIEIGRTIDHRKSSRAPADPSITPLPTSALSASAGTTGGSTGILAAISGALTTGSGTGTNSAAPAAAAAPAPGSANMTDDLLVLADEIARVPAGGGASTVRLLMQVVNDLGQTARDVPKELALLFEYKTLLRGDNGDGNQIIEDQSVKVDFTKPAVYLRAEGDASGTVVDNRTLMHRLANMITATDACTIPFLNKSLAEMHLSLLASLTPDTADTLHQLFVKITGMSPALADALCPGMARDIEALDALATAGVLDALIPIVKAFNDRGQIRLFIELMKIQDKHYDSIRQGEEKMVEVLRSGVVEKVFDVIAVTTQIEVPGSATSEKMADILADFLRHIVDRTVGNLARFDGTPVAAPIYLVLGPMRDLEKLIEGTPAKDSLSNLMTGITDLVVETKTLPVGRDNADREVLKNRFLIPFLSKALKFVVDKMGTDPAARTKKIADMQKSAADKIAARSTAQLVDLLIAFRDTQGSATFDRTLVNVLRANPDPTRDVYGVVVKLVAMGIQAKVTSPEAARQVAYFLGRVLEPSRGIVTNAIQGFAEILQRDQGRVILSMIRNSLYMGSDGNAQSPLEILMDVMGAIGPDACESGPMTRDRLIAKIDGVLEFLSGNKKGGLVAIYNVIKNRRR